MSLKFNCESCGSTLKIAAEHAGRRLKCPRCQQVMQVPAAEPVAAPPPLSTLPSDAADPVANPTTGPDPFAVQPATQTLASPPSVPNAFPTQPAPTFPSAPNSTGRRSAGGSVNASQHVAKGTKFHQMVGYVVLGLGILISIASTFGIAIIFWLIGLLTLKSQAAKAMAALNASSIVVSSNQFPEIYQSVSRMSQQLGMRSMPNVFIIESNEQNAFALKTGSKQNIVLIDDIVFGCRATGDYQTLDFILGHELAHHALGHTGLIRGTMGQFYRPLSRLDEFSCDAVANELVGDRNVSLKAITLLTIGPQLYPHVNQDALRKQVEKAMKDKKTKKSETTLTHPHILRRYGALLGMKI